MSEQLQLEDEDISIMLRRAWDRALRSLASRVNKPTFETHIRALRPVALSEKTGATGKPCYAIVLGVPNAFTREWVEKRHSSVIVSVLEEILDRDVCLTFVLLARSAKSAVSAKEASQQSLSLFGEESEHSAAGSSALQGEDNDSAFPLYKTDEPEPREKLPDSPAPKKMVSSGASGAAISRPASVVPLALPHGASGAGERHNKPFTASSAAPPPTRAAEAAPARRSTNSGAAEAPQLNTRYTFDTFVTGHSNRLAHAGAKAVAQSPGQVYNPLFLYGPPGLGKTHLMHSIGNEIVKAHGEGNGGRIAYVSGESFTSHFIASLREQRAEEFRRTWNKVDVWLVDDIQFIAGKERTKEEFFHTFNMLYQSGKQIVISSDRSPRDLRMMDERLRSRFECGLIADIAPPDLETRLAILQRKAEIERTRIPDDVLLYMARLIQSNIRTLEGALVKLIAYASLVNSPVTTQLASNVLERYFISAGLMEGNGASSASAGQKGGFPAGGGGEGNGPLSDAAAGSTYAAQSFAAYAGLGASSGITPEIVQRVVARRFGMTPDALTSKKRDRDVVAARQIAMHLMRELTTISLPGIGQLFGGRDHSTVMHSCDKVRSQLPLDDDLRTLVEDLMVQLRAAQQASE